MDEDYISEFNKAVDNLIEGGRTKAEIIENMRLWADNWELSDDD